MHINPSYLFLGATHFGKSILETLIKHGHSPKAIFSIPEYFNISYSEQKVRNCDFFDFSSLASEHNIPFYWVESPHRALRSYENVIKACDVDFMLVAGWYYKIPASVYELSRMGAFGFHNSLLPEYAGGAPLVWAMIEGAKEVGVSLFRMDEGMDTGDIINQKSFSIDFHDDIEQVLKKATNEAIFMSLDLFNKPITFTPQTKPPIYYPQRSPEDGKIDLNMNALDMYNFIRAQSKPYPGAFIQTKDGKRLVIDKAHIVESVSGGGALIKPIITTYSIFNHLKSPSDRFLRRAV